MARRCLTESIFESKIKTVLKISSLNTLYGRVTAPQSTSKTQVSSKKSNEGGGYFVTVPRFETYDEIQITGKSVFRMRSLCRVARC